MSINGFPIRFVARERFKVKLKEIMKLDIKKYDL
jgi:hypothetical protein